MKFQNLKPLDIEMADTYQKHFNLSKTRIADNCPNSRFSWDVGYHYRYVIIEDCLCFISDGGVFTGPHFTLPLGELTVEKLNKVLTELYQIFEFENWQFIGLFVDECYLDLFQQLPDFQVDISMDDDFSDYVYSTKKLARLKGKDYRTKRNHVNKFIRDYPDFEYRSLAKEDQEKAVTLVKTWCQDKEVNCQDPRESDCRAINQLFSYWDQLEVHGGVIYYNEDLIAFSMGTIVRDGKEAVIHFEKADPNYEGLYSVINQFTVFSEFDMTEIINREEDMGDPGLRMAKESYFPVEKIKKYRVLLHPLNR